MKLSVVGDQNQIITPRRADVGDKENNGEFVLQADNYVKDGRDAMLAQLSDTNAQQCAELARNVQVIEKTTLAQRKAEALHEQLRLDVHEAQITVKQKDCEIIQLNQQLQDKAGLQESCTMLEYQNSELSKRLRDSERQHVTSDKSLSLVEKAKQAELDEKDNQIHLLQCQIHDKDVLLQEMEREKDTQLQSTASLQQSFDELKAFCHNSEAWQEKVALDLHNKEKELNDKDHQLNQHSDKLQQMQCLIHDKDQSLQQLKHEHQKQDESKQLQLQDLNAEITTLRQHLQDEAAHSEQQTMATNQAIEAYKEKDEKEVRLLRQKLQDSKVHIENLASQLRRTSGAASIIAPGEFMRSIKTSEARNGFSQANACLVSRNAELESETLLIKKENFLLRRRLPVDVVEALVAEAVAEAVAASEEDGRAQTP